MGLTIFGVVLGAVIAILITILIEYLRKPRLIIERIPPTVRHYENHPAKKARFLYLRIINKPLPRWARWMSRNAATQCHGTITFYHLNEQDVFGRAMQARWSGSPEPVPMTIFVEDKQIAIYDPSRIAIVSRMDIYPGEWEEIDTVVKFDDEDVCYGWSNENYFSNPIWRNPNWRLASGKYLLKVTITTSGEKVTNFFQLINDVPINDFRLEPKSKKDNVVDE
jgi:hypothetical protein